MGTHDCSRLTSKPEVKSGPNSQLRGREVGFWEIQCSRDRNLETLSLVFTPVLAKHSKSVSLIDCFSVGVDGVQQNFEAMRNQVEMWQRSELTDVTAKVVIYKAFLEGKLEVPKHLARTVHESVL